MAGVVAYVRSVVLKPWVIAALVVCGLAVWLAWAAWGSGAAGLVVGIIGVVGTVVAGSDARHSSKDVADLAAEAAAASQAAKQSSDAAQASSQTAGAAVERVRTLADDLSLTSKTERRDRVKEAVRVVLVSAQNALYDLTEAPVSPEIAALVPVEPTPLDESALLSLFQRQMNALTNRGRLSLPSCIRLAQATMQLCMSLDLPTWHPEALTTPPRSANEDELRALIATAKEAWEEVDRPADQIPTWDA